MAKVDRSLTKKEVSQFKALLEAEKNRICSKGNQVAQDLAVPSGGGMDEADLASSDAQQHMSMRMGNRENFYLKKIIHALQRIEDGEYGECDSCGDFIGRGRLSSRPTAELCIVCKEEQERREHQSIHARKHKSVEGPSA